MAMKTIRAVSLAASALFAALSFDAVSGFNAASAAECTPGTVERDGHQVDTKCDPKTGALIRQIWLKDGKRDRADGPAFTLNDPKADTITEVWWKNDTVHRDDGPAIIRRNFRDRAVISTAWYRDGQLFVSAPEERAAWLKKSGERMAPPSPMPWAH